MIKLAKPGVDVGLVVKDAAAQLAFYGTVLGLKNVGRVPLPNGTLHVLACGNSLLKLYAIDTAELAGDRGGFGGQTGLTYITINVDNIEDVLAAVTKAGATVLTPLSEFDAGVSLPEPVGRMKARYAMLADAEGNRVELLQRS